MPRFLVSRGGALVAGAGLVFLGITVMIWLASRQSAMAQDAGRPNPEQMHRPKNYSPYVDRGYATRVYWGDQHLHTSFSADAGLVGDRLGPDDAFRFARGEQLRSSTGQLVQLERPYDWLVVSDHAEYIGLSGAFADGDPAILANPYGRRWAKDFKEGGQAGMDAFVEITKDFAVGNPSIPRNVVAKLTRPTWDRSVAAAETNNKPGKFTAFIGFEWTQNIRGNNLHRVVVFRDGAERALQVLPFSEFDSPDPEDLWKYMAAYEEKTGGRVLAIPHNSNLSGGLMFASKTWTGKDFDKQYAETRARFERLVEASQTKGDSETTPLLSPNDEFANFERWDNTNLFATAATTPEMLPFNYVRSALKLGLEHEAKLGVNPFKLGLIGGTDIHTSLSTTRAENSFGAGTSMEPKPERWKTPFIPCRFDPKLTMHCWQIAPGAMGGVWARENTRAAIWDAMERKETYCTTGTRPTVRIFGGWDFSAKELGSPDSVWVEQGYARGVPMGGDLTNPPQGKAPTFMIKALCDPEGAYLDRVQIVKGWLDSEGKTQEKVIDVAWSGDRKPDPATGKVPLVGNTVDVENATWTNTIGAPLLTGFWQDPDFDQALRAFYYVRLIEIPTPTWMAFDAKRFGVKMPDYVPMTVTNRAYTSPIWYSPAK
ncbi:MAG TPA: DUF3604 domain-containing protein [Gemmataceae bacterium]|nr:DUF3604 domain-containing protein [Gemmataceae bacterium]